MKRYLFTPALLFISLSCSYGQAEELKVSAAILNYVDALYEVKPELIRESVHPDLNKFGYWRSADAADYNDGSAMTFDQLVELAGTWNEKHWLPENAPKKIVIFDVQDKTASAKLTAHWGTDYFHLARIDGRWMIMNVLWQSPPRTEIAEQ